MMASPTTLTDKLGSAPKPAPTFWEKVQKAAEALSNETARRFEVAKQAYASEMAWQLGCRLPAAAQPAEVTTRILAGIAIDTETGSWIALQEGLNFFGAESLRVEQGRAEGSGARAAQSYFTNDTIVLNKKTYVLKLFSNDRFARRLEVKKEGM